jgi:hypothetical protein
VDAVTRSHSRGTYTLIRLEWIAALLVCSLLGLLHLDHIRWVPYLALFLGMDLVGTLPGTLAHRRAGGRRIAPIYYGLYNVTHSALFLGALALAWSLTLGPEWALVALPTHLCIDRGLFGNVLKSSSEPFVPSQARA